MFVFDTSLFYGKMRALVATPTPTMDLVLVRGSGMNDNVVILIAEDDHGHFSLITKNLTRAGIGNQVIQFHDGQETLDFLFQEGNGPKRIENVPYILLLDIRMPKVDGIAVLKRVKGDASLSRMPIVILTTTDDPEEVDLCHSLGCSMYIVKPVEYDDFTHLIRKMGAFFSIVKVPAIV